MGASLGHELLPIMPEMRFNHVTGDWVIIAPERAKRPGHVIVRATKNPLPSHVDSCPFCVGNERMTGDEFLSMADAHGAWRVRSVKNLYSALSADGEVFRGGNSLHAHMTGIGLHEVVIESPDHAMSPANMASDDRERLIDAYHRRFVAFYGDPRVDYVVVFKNHGVGAGTSLEHPHSQIVGTPVVPAQIRERLMDALRFRNDTGGCLYCETLRQELDEGARVVLENRSFVAFVPYAAMSPYHLWIFPKTHRASFANTTAHEREDLAAILGQLLRRVAMHLDDPDYNYVIRSLSPGESGVNYFHWYLAIVPRVTNSAGFELGTGMYINVSSPEESAALLRNDSRS